MKRAFTRADIIAHFERHWGPVYERSGGKVTIEKVVLLEGVTRPIWLLDYHVLYEQPDWHDHHDMLLFTQVPRLDGSHRLTTVDEVRLPEGAASVAEEDKAIKAREKSES